MLESALARLLHHHLGKYILDFDADNLNVGIFSGDIRLTDLLLKPEALYELDLPIAVQYGKVESILINIPWSFLKTRPVTITIQGIWLIAEPCTQNGDSAREKRLIRASRQNILNTTNEQVLSQLFAAIQYNIQLTINDIHIRYEDNASHSAFGACIQSISLQTTDRKWKVLNDNPNSTSSFQILKIESVSVYCDSSWEGHTQNRDLYTIRNELANGLKTFVIYDRPFDFLLKPATIKMKVTVRRISDEDNYIQMDTSLGDCVMQISRSQIHSVQLAHSLLKRAQLLRRWIDIRPSTSVTILNNPKGCRQWWRYALKAVVEQRIRPFTWQHLLDTRLVYKQYRDKYLQFLIAKSSTETEFKLDLLKCEDLLTLSNIILAREDARTMLLKQNCESVLVSSSKVSIDSLVHIDKPNLRCKLNLAIANGTLSLNNDEQEVFSLHISQLAVCAESGSLSFRLHTLLAEGLSYEDHLAPVISSFGYDTSTPIFTFEIKQNLYEGQYKISCNLESLEFIYSEYLIAEMYNFFDYKQIEKLVQIIKSMFSYSLPLDMDVNVCINKPKFLFPESGSLQKGSGNMLIITPGLIKATREGIQDLDLEAGLAELEERLYTRWTVHFCESQILLAESGDSWRDAFDIADSPTHFLHSCNGEMLLLLNMFPMEKRLPLYKYNLSLNTFKISSSTSKVTMLLGVIGNMPIPKPRKNKFSRVWQEWPLDQFNPESELFEFNRLKQSISQHTSNTTPAPTINNSTIERSSSSEATSDLVEDILAHTVDLPGFEDNVSPSNQIEMLVRVIVNETCIVISRFDGRNERSFLQLRTGKICFEGALLTFGPAVQINVESVLLTEQFHMGPAGQYLELIASGPGEDVFSLLYRKVRANCPDFRTHFRSVENSFVVDFGHLRLRWRSDACRAVMRYVRRSVERSRNSKAYRRLYNVWKRVKPSLAISVNDPPIPPGAVKTSRSIRIASSRLTLADNQTDLLELHFCGFEYDYTFRANSKLQLRLYLNALTIEDLSHLTLYPKIVGMEDDYIIELKYVGHSSHILQPFKNANSLPCDGNLRLQLGRIHIAPLGAKDFLRLLRPLPVQIYSQIYFQKLISFLMKNKLIFSIQIGGPTLLIPQKLDSPNVIIIHKGDISVENFYTEINKNKYYLNNILIKINNTNISRAVMSLGGSLQLQNNLLEPISLRLDIKQTVFTGVPSACAEPIWSISGSTDTFRIILGQCDITSITNICVEYLPKVRVVSLEYDSTTSGGDNYMNQLQAFLSAQGDNEENQQRMFAKFVIDGVYIELVSDNDEILSSPVRDMNRTLCRLSVNEINLVLTVRLNNSWKLNAVLKDLMFLNTKSNEEQSNSQTNSGTVLNLDIVQSNTSDLDINIILSSFHLQLSTLLITSLYQFVIECIPGEWPLEGGLENQGYEREANSQEVQNTGTKIKLKLSTFSVDIVLQDNEVQFMFNADLQFFHSVESYLNIENISLQLKFNGEQEWIIEPFNIKLIYTFLNQENNSKISAMITDMKIIISPRIVHSCLQFLTELFEKNSSYNDREHHFTQTNELELSEEMWLPKKLPTNTLTTNKRPLAANMQFLNETIIFIAPNISIILNLESNLPIMIYRLSVELELHEHCNIKLSLQSNYYNLNNCMWEPFIEPIGSDFRPYELNVNIFRTVALPVTSRSMQSDNKFLNRITSSIPINVTDTSGDSDTDSGEIMSFIRPPPERKLITPSPSLGVIGGEFESDLENDIIERITSTLTYLFTSDSSDEQGTDSNASSNSDNEHNSTNIEHVQHETTDTEQNLTYEDIDTLTSLQEIATYFVIHSKDRLEITLTPQSIKTVTTIIHSLTDYNWLLTETVAGGVNKKLSVSNILVNYLGLNTLVQLRDVNDGVICSSKDDYESNDCGYLDESEPPNTSSNESSPVHESQATKTLNRKKSSIDIDAALTFHKYTTSELYKHVTRTRLYLQIKGLTELTLTCPTHSCMKLVRLHPALHKNIYYAVVHVNVNGPVRTVLIRSPLQIRNETNYVLGLLYQADTLTNLNIPIQGESINPFEGRIRITLLQPQDTYNVPLFIAYHCKLFIQPTHLNSSISNGIFWSEISNPHIETCKMEQDNNNTFLVGVKTKPNLVTDKEIPQNIPSKMIVLLPPLIVHNCLPRDLKIFTLENEQYKLIEPSAQVTFYKINPLLENKLDVEFEYYGFIWMGVVTLGKDLIHKTICMSCSESTTERLNLLIRANWNEDCATCHIYIYSPFWVLNRTDLDLQIKGCGADVICSLYADTPALWSWPRGVRRKCVRLRVSQSNWSTAFPIDTSNCTGRIVCRDRTRDKKYRLLMTVYQAKATPLTTLVVLMPMFVVANHTELRLRFMEENENADLWFDIASGESLDYWPETASMHMYLKHADNRTISQRFPVAKQYYTVLRMGRSLPALCVSVTGGETSPFVISFLPYSPGSAPIFIVNRCNELFLKFNQKGLCQTALLSPNHSLLYTWDDPSAERQLIWNVYNNKGRGYELQFNEDSEGDETVEDSRGGKIYVAWICFMNGAQRTIVFAENKKTFSHYRHLERAQFEIYLSIKGFGLSLCTKENRELAYYSISDRPAKWEVNVSRKWKDLTADLSTWIEEQYQWNRQKCQLKDYLEIDLSRMLLIKPFFGDLRRSYSPGIWLQYRQGIFKQYIHLEVQNMQLDNQLTFNTNTSPIICQFTDKNFPCVEVFNLWSTANRAVYACSVQIRDFSVLLDTTFLKQCHHLWTELGPAASQTDKAKHDLKVLYSPIAPKEGDYWQLYQLSFASFTIQLNAYTGVDFLKSFYDVSRVQDKSVIIRITSIDIKNISKSFNKLIQIIYEHYLCTIMQQFYAFVLGQTVLLNPQEFSNDKVYIEMESLGALGLSEAAKRLVGHIRGAEPPFTATLFPLAECTFKNTRSSSDIVEAMLVVSGMCGSQINGEHIFRTALRCLLGFSSRDMLDCTGLILESIYRSQPNANLRVRLPRVYDMLYLEPFSWRRAVGQYLLYQISNKDDQYWAHASIDSNTKRLIVISFTCIYIVLKKQLWSNWEIEWQTTLDAIVAIPTIKDDVLVFSITEEEAERIGADNYKLSGDLTSLNWLKSKIEEVMILKIQNE